MKEICIAVLPDRRNHKVTDCRAPLQEKIRDDLRQYERENGISLPKGPEGDYLWMTGDLWELSRFLYERNPSSTTVLWPFLLPEGRME